MNDLLVYKKAEVLLNEVYPVVTNFPKAEKYALCQEIKQTFYELLKYIVLANNIKVKRRMYQEEADARQKLLLVLFTVAKEQKYLSKGKHYQIQLRLIEVGKLLGGWMKQT